MTDQELAQMVAERLRQHEAEATAAVEAAQTARERQAARRRVIALGRCHAHLDKAWLAVQPNMGLAPLSGSPIKPPQQ